MRNKEKKTRKGAKLQARKNRKRKATSQVFIFPGNYAYFPAFN